MIKVWHRRCGKDLDDFAFIVDQMLDRVGNYWHVFPLYTQGRKAVWEGFTSTGKRYIDHVPKELIKSMDKNQMTFELVNGSIFRIVGADNPDSMVGAGPVGAVFSEYSLIRPSVWGLMEPMLLENGGWARFNMTPRGENHAYEMLQAALKDIAERGEKSPWFVSILTIRDTGIITEEQIEDLRRNGRSEELIQQEYYCSFAGALEGAYYSRQMAKAAQEGRITSVPHDPSKQVFTFWDLGMNDPTCIWFVQDMGAGRFHVIDYWEQSNLALPTVAKDIIKQKQIDHGYNYGGHTIPHDGGNSNRQTGKTDQDILREAGVVAEVQPRTKAVASDIDTTRAILAKCWFDKEKCRDGLNSLKSYGQDWDDDKRIWKPRHDWASHGSDAFRYFAVHYKPTSNNSNWRSGRSNPMTR